MRSGGAAHKLRSAASLKSQRVYLLPLFQNSRRFMNCAAHLHSSLTQSITRPAGTLFKEEGLAHKKAPSSGAFLMEPSSYWS